MATTSTPVPQTSVSTTCPVRMGVCSVTPFSAAMTCTIFSLGTACGLDRAARIAPALGPHRTGQDTGGVGQFFLAIGGTVGAGIAGYIIIVFRVHLQVAATGAADTNDLTLLFICYDLLYCNGQRAVGLCQQDPGQGDVLHLAGCHPLALEPGQLLLPAGDGDLAGAVILPHPERDLHALVHVRRAHPLGTV